MEKCKHLSGLGTGWSEEEAEVAARDWSIWKLLTVKQSVQKCMLLTNVDDDNDGS